MTKHEWLFLQVELSRSRLTMMAASIFVSILVLMKINKNKFYIKKKIKKTFLKVNILLVLGCSGKRWRRLLVLPWLLFYGAGAVICIWTHLYYTSLCWREEKVGPYHQHIRQKDSFERTVTELYVLCYIHFFSPFSDQKIWRVNEHNVNSFWLCEMASMFCELESCRVSCKLQSCISLCLCKLKVVTRSRSALEKKRYSCRRCLL